MHLICGVVRLDGAAADRETLKAMIAALTSPGLMPRTAQRVEGPAALAMMDFSCTVTRALPVTPRGTWLAADLRLHRPGELAASLGLPSGSSWETLALAALDKWQDDLPDRVDGDFALAGWDPSNQRLTCLRDILGVRPLCYTYEPGRLFAFASLPRGLHASGVVSRRPDPVALGCILLRSYPVADQTGFKDIHWLRPGHGLVVTPQNLAIRRVWEPDASAVGRWRGSAPESAEIMRELIEEAVACRLPETEPVAVHLSGGLDSSGVAVVAARRLRDRHQRLHAFSNLPRPVAGVRDEREYIEAVLAQEPDILWSEVSSTSYQSAGILDPDLPLAGPIAEPDDRICSMAAALGCRILLSGAGGDEGATFNGSGMTNELLREGRWKSVYADLRARSARTRQPFATVAAKVLVGMLLPEWLNRLQWRVRGLPPRARRLNALSFLDPQVAQQVTDVFPSSRRLGSGPQDRVQLWTQDILSARADRWSILGARHGVSFSYPFADRRIIEFALSLPIALLMNGGYSRQPYRNAMRDILPESIRWRETKFSSFPDLPLNLASSTASLLTRVEALRRSEAMAGFVDLEAIAEALAAVPQGAEAQKAAVVMNESSFSLVPREFKMGFHGMRALILAEHLARMSALRRD